MQPAGYVRSIRFILFILFNLMGYAFILGSEVQEKGVMQMEVTAKFPLKKGGEKAKTTKQSMIFTYCPFCGAKYA